MIQTIKQETGMKEKDFTAIGKFIYERFPGIAHETRMHINRNVSPPLTDLENYFNKTLEIRGLEREFVKTKSKGRGSNRKREEVEIIICVLLKLFAPHSLYSRHEKYKRGVLLAISKLFGCSRSQVSHQAKKVEFFYHNYTSFRNKVNYIYSLLPKNEAKALQTI